MWACDALTCLSIVTLTMTEEWTMSKVTDPGESKPKASWPFYFVIMAIGISLLFLIAKAVGIF